MDGIPTRRKEKGRERKGGSDHQSHLFTGIHPVKSWFHQFLIFIYNNIFFHYEEVLNYNYTVRTLKQTFQHKAEA